MNPVQNWVVAHSFPPWFFVGDPGMRALYSIPSRDFIGALTPPFPKNHQPVSDSSRGGHVCPKCFSRHLDGTSFQPKSIDLLELCRV